MSRKLCRWGPLLALVTVGCVPVVPVLPSPHLQREPSTSELTPVERLGRWNGERFVEIDEASVPPSHVHVLVHGWAPGWADELRSDPELRGWEVEGFEPWVHVVARAISEADPYAVVLAYSWLDDAATSRFLLAQRTAWAHTERQGETLAKAIESATGEGFIEGSGRVHLVGHSYGARVATVAVLHMSKVPQHLTIFDSPDASMTYITGSQAFLGRLLAKLPIGRGAGDIFVDNYVSMVGTRFRGAHPNVVDVALSPPYGTFNYRGRHLYPPDFYAQTVGESFGLSWSPLIAGATPAGGCWAQPYGEVALRPGCVDAP